MLSSVLCCRKISCMNCVTFAYPLFLSVKVFGVLKKKKTLIEKYNLYIEKCIKYKCTAEDIIINHTS